MHQVTNFCINGISCCTAFKKDATILVVTFFDIYIFFVVLKGKSFQVAANLMNLIKLKEMMNSKFDLLICGSWFQNQYIQKFHYLRFISSVLYYHKNILFNRHFNTAHIYRIQKSITRYQNSAFFSLVSYCGNV